MKRSTAVTAIVVAAAVLGAFLLTRGGPEPYRIAMRLDNAGGLSPGSPVTVGGVEIGKVELNATQDEVRVDVEIDPKYAPLSKNTRAVIIARNALGQKQLLLSQADGSQQPAPDGYELPSEQVQQATDLDQLLGTLDARTRTSLAIVLNEAGMTFAGRKLDFKAFLEYVAPAMLNAEDLIGQLTQDNLALGNLLETSDRYVAEVAREREKLGRMIDLVGGTTETVAARRLELRETLRRAPASLATARDFLADLRATTAPLGSTARLLADAAPPLATTLDRIEPFRAAAAPTLESAREAVPALNELTAATPAVQKLLGPLESARTLVVNEVPPVGDTLDKSMDNLLATLENWSRAIQFRDGLSHVFRGEASFAPSFYERILENLGAPQLPVRRQRDRKDGDATGPAPTAPTPSPTTQSPVEPAPSPTPSGPIDVVEDLADELPGSVDEALPRPGKPSAAGPQADPTDLLDFLLGP